MDAVGEEICMLISRDFEALAATRHAKLTKKKSEAVDKVNQLASIARKNYVTDIPGQEMLYMAKEFEAIKYIASGTTDLSEYPLIAAEVGITAPSAYELAQLWVNLGSVWRSIAAQIENKRMSIISSISSSQTENDIENILKSVDFS